MKKGFIVSIILVTGILFAAGVGQFTKINLIYDSGSAVYFNQLSSGKSDSLFFRLSDELTSYQLYPFPDSLSTGLTGTVNEVEVTDSGNNNYIVGLPDDVTIGSDLTVTDNIYQGDSDYHYFGDDNNMRAYHDGTQAHIEPAYVVTNPDTLQILFSNPDSIFTADGDIKDWSGNGYDAEMDSSYAISFNGTDNRIDLGSNWLNDMIGGKGYCKIETYIKFDIQSNNTYVFTGESYGVGGWTIQLWASAGADSTLLFIAKSFEQEVNRVISSTNKVVDGTWYKVEYIADLTNDDMYIYVDDVVWASNTSVGFGQNTFYSSTSPPTVSDGIGQDARLTNPYPKYDMAYINFYTEDGLVAEFPFSGYGNDKVYDVVGKDKFSVSGTAGTLWGEKQGEYHYNIEYGFTDSTNIYIPYALDGTVLASGGTNHPAGLWHNNCETQICFNPNNVAGLITARGWGSTDFYGYSDIINYIGTGTGDFTVTTDTNKKSNMITFDGSVSQPDAGFLATGKLHDPDAQLSNKSRGITNATKNLELLNNSGDTLLVVYDDGTVDVATLNTGQGDNELYDMNQNVLTTSDVTFNSVTSTTFVKGEHLESTDDAKVADSLYVGGNELVHTDLYVDGNFYPMAVIGKMIEENESGSVLTITVADTFYQWVSMDSLHSTNGSHGIAYEDSTHSLVVPFDGKYLISASAAISLDATGTVHMGFAKNGVIGTYGKTHYEFKFANQDISISGIQAPTLVVGDKLSLWFTSDGTDDISIFHCSFIVTWLGR